MKIKKLILENFRNYAHKECVFEHDFIVFVGKNGQGKTNIIEALSCLSQEGTFRKNKLEELGKIENGTFSPWTVEADIVDKHIPYTLKVSYEGQSQRTIEIDKKKATPKDLANFIRYVVLTPAMDKVFIEGAPAVRRVVDRMIVAFDPLHAERLSQLNKLIKERYALGEKQACSTWKGVNANFLAQHAISVATARVDFVERLNKILLENETKLPSVKLTCNGLLEDALKEKSALEVEEWYQGYLEKNREDENIDGAHRSQFDLIHLDKKMRANLCSTGEQKIMLLSLLLGQAKLIQEVHKQPPIFLLDEGLVHLDKQHQEDLIKALKKRETAVFLTDIEGQLSEDSLWQKVVL